MKRLLMPAVFSVLAGTLGVSSTNGGTLSACGWRGTTNLRCYEETNGCFNYQQETTGTCHKSATGQVESMRLDRGAIKTAVFGCPPIIHASAANCRNSCRAKQNSASNSTPPDRQDLDPGFPVLHQTTSWPTEPSVAGAKFSRRTPSACRSIFKQVS